MADELDAVVRNLEAERHRPSVWWNSRNNATWHLYELATAIGDLDGWRKVQQQKQKGGKKR